MVWAVSLLTMKLIPHRLTSCLEPGIQSLSRFGTALAARTETVLYPQTFNHSRCASTHFGENQLAPGSIGISPLTTPHPPIFQHRSVRTSTWCYPSFILDMVRSPGFGSITSDNSYALFRLAFALATAMHLNLPHVITRRLILQQARGQTLNRPSTACRLTVSCSISLPSRGSFHLSLAVLFHYRSHSSI